MEQALILAIVLFAMSLFGYIWFFVLRWKFKNNVEILSEDNMPFSDSHEISKFEVVSMLFISVILTIVSLILVLIS